MYSIQLKALPFLGYWLRVVGAIMAFPLRSVRQCLERLHVDNVRHAHLICRLIPAQCPFARTIRILGRPVVHIPPLCKLNPFYEQLVALRFQSLCFLAEQDQDNVSLYC